MAIKKVAPRPHDVKLVNEDGTPIMFADAEGKLVPRQLTTISKEPNFRVAFGGFFYDFDHADTDGAWVFVQKEAF